jgi:DNA-binding NtrC family response regulator
VARLGPALAGIRNMSESVPVVAILNSNDDIVELLRMALEQAGLVVVSAHVDAVKRGDASLLEFMREHRPDVVLYDVVPPYDRSWRFLEHLRDTSMRGQSFVITSTNPNRARELAGTTEDIYEIVGKPYDIDKIVDAVRGAARLREMKD